jgi:hypothetical protein
MKNFKSLFAAAALALAVPLSASAAGAIAVDDQVGDKEPGYGFATGHKNRDDAGRAAMKECRKSGNDSCKIVARFDNCGAYASSKKYSGAGWGKTQKAAERMALEKCGHERCKVHVSECDD